MFAAPQTAPAAHPPGIAGLVEVTFALLVVLAAVFLLAWVLRRVRSFGARLGDAVDVLADVPLGPKERAVLLRVGHKQILLGVAPGRVNALHVLEEPIELPRAAAPGATPGKPSFGELLKRSLGK